MHLVFFHQITYFEAPSRNTEPDDGANGGVRCRDGQCKEVCHRHHELGTNECREHPGHEDVRVLLVEDGGNGGVD